jgi:hypothetical protein
MNSAANALISQSCLSQSSQFLSFDLSFNERPLRDNQLSMSKCTQRREGISYPIPPQLSSFIPHPSSIRKVVPMTLASIYGSQNPKASVFKKDLENRKTVENLTPLAYI